MPTHVSPRLAWHMDGWNGRICGKPSANHYCIGPHSYPGDKIRDGRDLDWEEKMAGQACSKIKGVPPCVFSINAFGSDVLTAQDDPPDFFGSGTRTTWNLPPATVCVWPYEAMYTDDAKTSGRVDNEKRLVLAKQFFAAIEPEKSLVFHYANYSNPLSGEDAKRYVVIGLARVKKLGRIEYYAGTDKATQEKYAGGYVWQMNVETLYPDQGLRIPYHRYLDQPDVLEKIALFPDNPRNFKYGSRHLSDDDALSLVERFVEIASYLREAGDDSENWSIRLEWLNSLLAELWTSRGLYPGLARVLDIVGVGVGVAGFRAAAAKGEEKQFHDRVFSWLYEKSSTIPGVTISASDAARVRRQWKLRSDHERKLLSGFLPRFDLPKDQMERALSEKRSENCRVAKCRVAKGLRVRLVYCIIVGNGINERDGA